MGYKINPQTQGIVCCILAAGGKLEHAADAIGCTERALYAARNRDPEFDKQVRQCQSRSRHESLIKLADAAKEDGNLAYKRLRMLYPDDYARGANTLPVNSVDLLLKEMYFALEDAIDDPKVMEKICHCLLGTRQDARDRKIPKADRGTDKVLQGDFGEDVPDVEGELEALADHSADEALKNHSADPDAETA